MTIIRKLIALLFACLAIGACELPETVVEDNDQLLARVHNISLYLSELEGMFPHRTTAQDSNLIINSYVERWVRDALLLYEAEKNIPKDLNIDKLVQDYRASLVLHNYEKILVDQLLDSSVSREELMAFYEENKEQYQLETPILRCQYIKIPLPVPNAATLRAFWNSKSEEDLANLQGYCAENAVAYQLADSTWHRFDNIADELPAGTISSKNVRAKLSIQSRDDTYQYYFRVLEVRNTKEIAPLAFIEEQARKVILRQRKIQLLEKKKEEMYDLALRRNDIQLFLE